MIFKVFSNLDDSVINTLHLKYDSKITKPRSSVLKLSKKLERGACLAKVVPRKESDTVQNETGFLRSPTGLDPVTLG
ncbi:unnamed protein product [Bubo scandiacus]